jgi:hypothetical protein
MVLLLKEYAAAARKALVMRVAITGGMWQNGRNWRPFFASEKKVAVFCVFFTFFRVKIKQNGKSTP